jgi:hypothetical protein
MSRGRVRDRLPVVAEKSVELAEKGRETIGMNVSFT